MNSRIVFFGIILLSPLIWLFFRYIAVEIKNEKIGHFDGSVGPITFMSNLMDTKSPPSFIDQIMKVDFKINEEIICETSDLRKLNLLIVVQSAPANVMNRQAIRETWGSMYQPFELEDIRLIFLLGLSKKKEVNDKLLWESNDNRDIVQCGFVDDYQNLTLKSICMLRWVTEYCPNIKLLFKTDEDMYININNLIKISSTLSNKNLIFGLLYQNTTPFRNPKNRYYVSRAIFPGDVYPDYVRGGGYGITGDVVSKLLDGCKKANYINMEDIFITGLCANIAGVPRLNAAGFPQMKITKMLCGYRTIVAGHRVNIGEMRQIFKNLNDPSIKC